MYKVGNKYTRADIYKILNIPESKQKGDWQNGYHRHENDYYIFCNIGIAGRTGHDYNNHWDSDKLIWFGKNQSHYQQQTIKNLISYSFRVLVFYRFEDRSPFTYAGVGKPQPQQNIERPVRIDWTFNSDDNTNELSVRDELLTGSKFKEGTLIKVSVNRYERDSQARKACIEHYGVVCQVCDFNFESVYGNLGEGFIHVHHIKPISEIGASYIVDPIKDLVPVCPNCHAMLHRRDPLLAINQLKKIIHEHIK
jgi:5-methylcytosine-specific restriction protein A